MVDVYLICLMVGGGLFLLSLLGGHDSALGEHGADVDHPEMGDVASWFTVRSLVSFTAFFGLAGVLGGVAGVSGWGRLVMALVTGLAVGGFTVFMFRLARGRGEVNGGTGKLAGRTGQVLVAPAPGRSGQVAVTVAGQIEHAPARSDDPLKPGDPVIVIGAHRGVLDVKFWDGGL
ncbi:NfeD family protein [Deinococcus aerophilus]|uniref:NfeD-like C-terminal domain-containing protein n=1 Tax=Deinococcus aerophilus TaxID=522488 RepID=A0ABQ2GUG5_9DEIO|nr:hypothetical protein [Deinococcus aerophilus]GGM12379.1 hypothetical protein GCM10010841_21120 [Deinococcus aerophilus]